MAIATIFVPIVPFYSEIFKIKLMSKYVMGVVRFSKYLQFQNRYKFKIILLQCYNNNYNKRIYVDKKMYAVTNAHNN